MAAFAFLSAMALLLSRAHADLDILADYLVPSSQNSSNLTSEFFTFTKMRNMHKYNLRGIKEEVIIKATTEDFPALNGQGVSAVTILFPPGAINHPHTHPRAAELLMVLRGTVKVGFVDEKNKLFMQTLQAPDLFVFPKGLVHFQLNLSKRRPATAIGMFGSSDAGTVQLRRAIFGSGINEGILAKSFRTDVATIDKIVKAET